MTVPEATLRGRRVLVVEDDFLIAKALSAFLRQVGAEIIGPVGTVKDAERVIVGSERLDAAVIDINLRGEPVYPIAEMLQRKRVPFVFTTGYESGEVPAAFVNVPRMQKPVIGDRLLQAIVDEIAATSGRQS